MKLIVLTFCFYLFEFGLGTAAEPLYPDSYQIYKKQPGITESGYAFKPAQPESRFPDVQLFVTPAGVSYGAHFSFPEKNHYEGFSIPKLAETHLSPGHKGIPTDSGTFLGTGIQKFEGSYGTYGGYYKTSSLTDQSNNIFILGVGEGNLIHSTFKNSAQFGPGLFIGAAPANGLSAKNLNAPMNLPVKIGAVLPTGTGLLTSYSANPDGTMKLNSENLFLHKSWENTPSQIKNGLQLQEQSYLAETNSYKFNPISNYFPKQAIAFINQEYGKTGGLKITEESPRGPAVTPRSFVNFYRKSDPTGQGGPTQFAYSLQSQKTFEYASSNGFHYAQFPVEKTERIWSPANPAMRFVPAQEQNIIAKQYSPAQNKEWELSSSVQQSGLRNRDQVVRRFTKENQGTAELYRTEGRLSLNSAQTEEWRTQAQLQQRQTRVFSDYRQATENERTGLEKAGQGIKNITDQLALPFYNREKTALPHLQTQQVNRAFQTAKPFLEKGYKTLEQLSSSMEIANKTMFINNRQYAQFSEEQKVSQQTYSASKTLVPRLERQNEIRSDAVLSTDQFEHLLNQAEWQKKVSRDIRSDLHTFEKAGDLFQVGGLKGSELIYAETSKNFADQHFSPSNIQHAKARMFSSGIPFRENPLAHILGRSSGLLYSAQALSLEGRENFTLWKRVIGDQGENIVRKVLPMSTLGERMISAYSNPVPPTAKNLVTAGILQTIEEIEKIVEWSGLNKPNKNIKSFSNESFNITKASIKNKALETPLTASFTAIESSVDHLCGECTGLKKAVTAAGFAAKTTGKIGYSYRTDLSGLEKLGTKLSMGEQWKLLKNHSAGITQKETQTELIKAMFYKGIDGLNNLPASENQRFFIDQLRPTLQTAVPLTANWLGKKMQR